MCSPVNAAPNTCSLGVISLIAGPNYCRKDHEHADTKIIIKRK